MKKYFGKFVPKKEWFDTNSDGNVDYHDFLAAAQNVVNSVKPSKNILDINGDGVVDINDALDAARITGATIAGVGVTFGVGAVAGSVLVTGKATAIATVIASSIGSTAGAGLGAVFGTTSAVSWGAIQLASGSWIIATKTVVATSPTFVTAMSTIGGGATTASSGIVNTLAGFPVIQSAAASALVSQNKLLVIAGVPVAREVALATGLVALIVVGGYAYYVLTRKQVKTSEVEAIISSPPQTA